jgi:hypothetical protein
MPSSSSSLPVSWGSPFTCRLRRFWRLLLLATLLALALTFATRSLGASSLRYIRTATSAEREATIARLSMARDLFPLDHHTRASVASYYVVARDFDDRKRAIRFLEQELKHDPYEGSVHLALIAYYLADNNEAAATGVLAHLKTFRRGIKLERD